VLIGRGKGEGEGERRTNEVSDMLFELSPEVLILIYEDEKERRSDFQYFRLSGHIAQLWWKKKTEGRRS